MDTSGVPACAGIAGSGCMDGGTGKCTGCAFAGDKEFSGQQKSLFELLNDGSMRSRLAAFVGWLLSMIYQFYRAVPVVSEVWLPRQAFFHEKVRV